MHSDQLKGVGWHRPWVAVALLFMIVGLVTAAFAQSNLLQMQNEAGQWVMPNGNYAAWNYSPLDQINAYNVKNLQVKWTMQLGVTDSLEAEPLIIGNTMYVLTPKPNTLYALDLSRDGYVKWAFKPDMPGLKQATACCGAQSRGLAYADGNLIFSTLDGQLFSINADTGAVNWKTQTSDLSITETTPGQDLVVDGHVIVGVEGGERGVRGYVAAYNLQTGKQDWKFYSTGPNADMGITDKFKPFYPADKVANPGTSTWYGDSWKHGGGTVWGWMSYSPKLDLFYYGTGNCGPWNPDYRRDPTTAPGLDKYTNKYCSSVLARDAKTGELVWAYQATPQDQWDFDQVDNPFLINLTVNGQQRYALVKADRNGYFYAWDAATGEMLYQPQKYTPVSWSDHVDMTTGEPVMNKDALVYTGQKTGEICPFINGNNWFNDSYNPKTGLVYFNSFNRCNTGFTGTKSDWTPGGRYLNVDFGDSVTGPGGYLGAMQAWNPNTGKMVWNVKTQDYQNRHPLMSTGGNLIFSGTDQGYLQAINATTGETIWKFRTGSGFRNSPVSYIGPDGKQYLAVITSQSPNNPAVDQKTAPDDAARYARTGTTLYVFGLP